MLVEFADSLGKLKGGGAETVFINRQSLTAMNTTRSKMVSRSYDRYSAGRAARIVLTARAGAVQENLGQLADHADEAEPVHHTRVATRRLAAALSGFRALAGCGLRSAAQKSGRADSA